MSNILAVWESVSLLGTDPKFPESLNRKLVLGNRVACIAALLVFAMSFVYLEWLPQFTIYMGGAAFCLAFLVLNFLRRVNFSRIFFTIGVPFFMAVGGFMVPEEIRSTQKMALLSSITIPLVLFGITEKRLMIMGLAWTILCFMVVDFVKPDNVASTKAVFLNVQAIEYLSAALGFSVFVATYIYLQSLNLQAERRLKELLLQSTEQRDEISKQKKALEEANRSLRIKALNTQLNPHFLYNALNSIQHFLTINDKTSSINYMAKFGKLIRQVMEYADKASIPLSEELKLLEYYLELESLRFGGTFVYKIDIDEELLLYNIQVPTLLIQLHVENAILHGLMSKQHGERNLTITFKRENDWLICVIEDNGIGRQASFKLKEKRREKHQSRGIALSTERVALMYDEYEHTSLIKISDLFGSNGEAAGTRVKIRIPFEDT